MYILWTWEGFEGRGKGYSAWAKSLQVEWEVGGRERGKSGFYDR